MFGGKKRNQDTLSEAKDKTSLGELTHLFDQLETIISETKKSYIKSIQSQAEDDAKPKRSRLVPSFKSFGRKSEVAPSAPGSLEATSNGNETSRSDKPALPKEEDARFMPMPDDNVKNVVEIIRRISELVIFAEKASIADNDEETENNIAIFDCFFERNGLALITDILTGVSFDLRIHTEKQKKALKMDKSPRSDDLVVAEELLQGFDIDDHNYMLLPPLAIATQAIQSVAMLVQNVTRVTSLFFILSNNHINELINFPLEQYHIAERKKHNQERNGMSPRRFGSPELAELTTHYVTFLKSLALRMNAQTLQFFLTYPEEAKDTETKPDCELEPSEDTSEHQGGTDCQLEETEGSAAVEDPASQNEHTVEKIRVEFPLYERALEFCSAHQDSFVRVTALNICLNTLRLAATPPETTKLEDDSDTRMVTPTGVLHDAKVLPMRERLAIAQFVSSPVRVERLVSPIFTKLAELWGMFEEQFRDLDTINALGKGKGSDGAIDKDKAKLQRRKLTSRQQKSAISFNDTAASVQDEMLLLEDVLNVGLTTLNEQTIEMMFATFVYPLLLQPLLLYFQRSTIPDDVLYADPISAHNMGEDIKDSALDAGENAIISAPAKSALFLLTAVFQFITNKPLLRLLFTALFHPLSPGTTEEKTFRVEPQVACVDENGEVSVRIDPIACSIYPFGGSSGATPALEGPGTFQNRKEECVFVLCPALAEIVDSDGDNQGLAAKSRRNPYRKAIFQCFKLSNQLSDLQPFTIIAVDTAFAVFNESFLSTVLFGVDIETGVGYSDLDLMNEVLSAFQSCVVKATPGIDGKDEVPRIWKLEYDMVAAHAFLYVIDSNLNARKEAKGAMRARCLAAAAFLSDMPTGLENLRADKYRTRTDAQSSTEEARESYRRIILDKMFRGDALSNSLLKQLLRLKSDQSSFFLSVATRGSYSMFCQRSCEFPPFGRGGFDRAMHDGVDSAKAWASLDAYTSLLTITESERDSFLQAKQGGIALKQEGKVVPTFKLGVTYVTISKGIESAMLEEDKSGDSYVEARPRSVVSLIGRTAFPCVCEVPPSCAPLFSDAGAKVVSQGITWQSLYLVILGWNLVLAEPERSSSGDGRVVTSCRLENLVIQKDTEDLPASTSARRLIVSHDGEDPIPPGLFLFEATPKARQEGVFVGVEKFRSSVDIWFEDQRALDLAFLKVDRIISLAKAHRGQLIYQCLRSGVDANTEKGK
eukprot:scaffold2783_cov129-Cylindrotheca_fusiformis.AAC.3